MYGGVGRARSVEEADIAVHHARVLARAVHHVGFLVVQTFAVDVRAYLIYIVHEGRHAGVLPRHFRQLVGHHGPLVATLLGAQHLEVVDGPVVGGPGEHHAALACLGAQHLVNLARALVVERGERGLRISGRRVGERSGDRHHLVALLLPAIAQSGQQLLGSGCLVFSHFDGCHHWLCPAIDQVPLGTQLLHSPFLVPDTLVAGIYLVPVVGGVIGSRASPGRSVPVAHASMVDAAVDAVVFVVPLKDPGAISPADEGSAIAVARGLGGLQIAFEQTVGDGGL